nr:hypothetical protein [Tanacetum cinerariifolium]
MASAADNSEYFFSRVTPSSSTVGQRRGPFSTDSRIILPCNRLCCEQGSQTAERIGGLEFEGIQNSKVKLVLKISDPSEEQHCSIERSCNKPNLGQAVYLAKKGIQNSKVKLVLKISDPSEEQHCSIERSCNKPNLGQAVYLAKKGFAKAHSRFSLDLLRTRVNLEAKAQILENDQPDCISTSISNVCKFFVPDLSLLFIGGDTEKYNDLCDYDQYCRHCGALFWYGERLKGRAYDGKAEYNLCCGGTGGGVVAGALLATEIGVADFQLSLIWILTDHFT